MVKPFVYGVSGIGWGKEWGQSDGVDYKIKLRKSIWKIGGGFAFFLNDKVSIDLGLAYGYNSWKVKCLMPASIAGAEFQDIKRFYY